jgi:hypothetical protein
MSNCTERIKTDDCAKERDEGHDNCTDNRDEGYSDCTQKEDKGYSECCDWWPCSWACDAMTWIENIVCVLWTWVQNMVCYAWEWVKNIVCVAWKYITRFVCIVADGFSSFLNLLAAVIDVVLSIVGGVIAFIVDIITSLPFIGRVIEWILNAAKTLIYASISWPDAILTLLGIMPEKKLKLLVIIQRDSERKPVVNDLNVVYRDIQYLINTFRAEMNIRVLPTNLFMYKSAFADDAVSLEDFVKIDDGVSSDRTLDICCDACAFGNDLTSIGSSFNLMMARLGFTSSARRLLGYGAPIVAFAVRNYTDGKAGCSMGPLSDYITVKFNELNNGDVKPNNPLLPNNHLPNDQLTHEKLLDAVTDLAHEVGHCCYLLHYPSVNDNLMDKSPPRTGHLNVWQKIIVRTSRHVTYL